MIAKYLIITGGAIILMLGAIHLYYTFFTKVFVPKNTDLLETMKRSTISLAKGTNLWNAWVGFNGSHSAGAIFFGVLNIYLASNYFDLYKATYFLHFLNIL